MVHARRIYKYNLSLLPCSAAWHNIASMRAQRRSSIASIFDGGNFALPYHKTLFQFYNYLWGKRQFIKRFINFRCISLHLKLTVMPFQTQEASEKIQKSRACYTVSFSIVTHAIRANAMYSPLKVVGKKPTELWALASQESSEVSEPGDMSTIQFSGVQGLSFFHSHQSRHH